MPTDESRVNELIEIFGELADTAGGMERTSIFPNLEVIDNAPAGLSAYIIIQDQEGFYIPALKVPGLIYNNGDFVNVLFIKGTEPIAFQHGSSSGGGPSAGWPFATIKTVSTVDAQADYTTLTLALAAAVDGWEILLDAETLTAPNVAGGETVADAVAIVGLSPEKTVLTRADNTSTTITISDTPVTLRNIAISHTGAGAGNSNCIANAQASLILDNVVIQKTSGAASNAIGLNSTGGDTLLRNCKVNVTSGSVLNYAVYLNTAGSTVVLEDGEVLAGTLVTAHASAVLELRGVRLASGVTIDTSGGGVVKGWYLDTNDNIWHSVGGNTFKPLLLDNYIIAPSVASNNLTVALKNYASNDPSAAEPVAVRIGDTIQTITSALSTTKNAGTNWCNSGSSELATSPVEYFVYLIQETGASAGTKIGFSRVPYANTMGDFVNTATDEKYIAGNWTNFNASDSVTLIGRFRATLSAGAGYTWSSPGVVINYRVYESSWLPFTPSATPGTGAFTTLGTLTGSYKITGSTLLIQQSVPVTTNGTAGTYVNVTMPMSAAVAGLVLGKEANVTGNMLQGVSTAGANTLLWTTYNNGYPLGDGYNLAGGIGIVRLI